MKMRVLLRHRPLAKIVYHRQTNHLEQIDFIPNVWRLSKDARPFLVYIDNLLLDGFENTLFVIVVLPPSVKTSTEILSRNIRTISLD